MSPSPSRREFLGSAAVVGASLPAFATGRPRGRAEVLRVGLVGCGGRGGGAAINALNADPDTHLVALADAFEDHLEGKLAALKADPVVGERVLVDDDHKFVGWDAYQGVIDTCDVVLLATSPHFRPLHVEAAVAAGKHLFVEKPVATDAPGARRIQAACAVAREKGLSVVSGLCYRYENKKRETFRRLHEGAIGEITALQCTYNTGELWYRTPTPEWTPMDHQMRNWLYHTWLSGDHIAEQHIHSLDKILWAMQDEAPVKCTASGGRIKRTEERFGDVYDHFNTVFEWQNGVRGFSSCRQMSGTTHDVSDFAYGTEGVAHLQGARIESKTHGSWRWRSDEPDDMYQNEHDALFASIRSGTPIDDSDYMIKSTMMAIMGRMSAYTGQSVTWMQAWSSELDLTPPAYAWGEAPAVEIARPGVTKFV